MKKETKSARTITIPNARPCIRRFSQIVSELIQGTRTNGELAALCEVSEKTISRDFEFLIYSLDLPIKTDNRGHRLVGPVCVCSVCSAPRAETKLPAGLPAVQTVQPTYKLVNVGE